MVLQFIRFGLVRVLLRDVLGLRVPSWERRRHSASHRQVKNKFLCLILWTVVVYKP